MSKNKAALKRSFVFILLLSIVLLHLNNPTINFTFQYTTNETSNLRLYLEYPCNIFKFFLHHPNYAQKKDALLREHLLLIIDV